MWPRVKDARLRQPVVGKFSDSLPIHAVNLTAALEYAQPSAYDTVPERCQRAPVRRHGMVGEEPCNNLLQVLPLFGDGVVHPPPQFLLDLPDLRLHTVTA